MTTLGVAPRRRRTPKLEQLTSVLLVEDDPEDELMFRETVPTSVEISCVRNLDELRDRLDEAVAADVVVLDLSLPGVRGIKTLTAARQLLPRSPFVVLTGTNDLTVAKESLAAGAQDFLPKQDLAKIPWTRLERVLLYAVERQGLLQQLDDALSEMAGRERLFRTLADRSTSIVFRVRLLPEPAVEYINDAVETITGTPAQLFIDDLDETLRRLHPDDAAAVLGVISALPTEATTLQYRFRHQAGHWIHIEQSLQPIWSPGGSLVAVQGVARDVSAQVSQTASLQEELADKQRQVEAAQGQRLEAMGRLAAGMAHELNTPLQFISDNVRFVGESIADLEPLLAAIGTDGPLDPTLLRDEAARIDLAMLRDELPEALADATDGLARMARLVLAIKEFAHPGTGEKIPVDINHLVQSTATVSRNEWKYVAELSTDLAADLPTIRGERDKLGQVLLNLIVNAAQAIAEAGDQGRIRITTGVTEAGVTVQVTDDGPGIPQDIIDKIWDPFFTTKEVGYGSGQGLAIARSIIVDGHGGDLRVASEPGGTTFTLTFPIEPDEKGATA